MQHIGGLVACGGNFHYGIGPLGEVLRQRLRLSSVVSLTALRASIWSSLIARLPRTGCYRSGIADRNR